jgi:hypothetical protein
MNDLEYNWRYRAAERIRPELRVESLDQDISVQAKTKQAYIENLILCVTVTIIFRVV